MHARNKRIDWLAPPWKCPYCDHRSLLEIGLFSHWKEIHKDKPYFSTGTCNMPVTKPEITAFGTHLMFNETELANCQSERLCYALAAFLQYSLGLEPDPCSSDEAIELLFDFVDEPPEDADMFRVQPASQIDAIIRERDGAVDHLRAEQAIQAEIRAKQAKRIAELEAEVERLR